MAAGRFATGLTAAAACIAASGLGVAAYLDPEVVQALGSLLWLCT